jgi:hypothetical protein
VDSVLTVPLNAKLVELQELFVPNVRTVLSLAMALTDTYTTTNVS